jgi:catechol 2,3-dioxygenase-like lactoylglutathione lyase family enzyme
MAVTAEKKPWMPAPDYGRSLRPGIGINLLVSDVQQSVKFAAAVLGATETYSDANFGVLRFAGSEWMVHADHTFQSNPLSGIVAGMEARGAGVELRLYGCDPDQAEEAARQGGWTVLAGSIDKPHGLRECMIIDDDGYLWVPGVALPEGM